MVLEYVSDIEKIVNRGKLGLATHQNQWRFPLAKDGKSLESGFSLKNNLIRSMFEKIDDIIEVALRFHAEQYCIEWRYVIMWYLEILEILFFRKPFSDKIIYDLQDKIDIYFFKWIKLCGRNGMTNYIHFKGSGHVCYYLFKYRNLYQCSQQIFETMMSKIKAIYHKCTSR